MARSLRSLSASSAAAPTHRSILAPHLKKPGYHHPPRQRQLGSACDPDLNYVSEGVAAIAPFGTHGALREGEALDARDDRVGHAVLTIPHTVVPRRRGGCTAVGMAPAAWRAFPADDTGSSPHVRRPTSRCRC